MNIREVEISDAAKMIAFVKAVLQERDVFLLRTPDEFNLTVAEEENFIREFQESPNSIFLIAEVEGEIVGLADLRGGKLLAEHHCAELSIAIAKTWRGKGVGRQMIDYLLTWAKANPMLKRVFLFVAAPNENAIKLYERCGFVKEGRMRGDYYRNGSYYDSYIMGLWLGD